MQYRYSALSNIDLLKNGEDVFFIDNDIVNYSINT